MAISNAHIDIEVPGAAKQAVAEVTLDSSYPSGGYAFSAATFGLTILDFAIPMATNSGYLASLDQAGKKVKLFRQGAAAGVFTEETAGTNVSTVKVYFLVKGN